MEEVKKDLFKILSEFDKAGIRLWWRFKYTGSTKGFILSDEIIREYFEDTKEHNMLSRVILRVPDKEDEEIYRSNINPNLRKGDGYKLDGKKYVCIMYVRDDDEKEHIHIMKQV